MLLVKSQQIKKFDQVNICTLFTFSRTGHFDRPRQARGCNLKQNLANKLAYAEGLFLNLKQQSVLRKARGLFLS